MCFESGIQIDVRDDLSVNNDECVTIKQCARVLNAAARAENHRLFNVMQFDAISITIAQSLAYRFGAMMQVDYDLIAAVTSKILCDITDQRFSEDRNSGLGSIFS